MSHQKHILVSPLDWGLGHATRCIPVIQSFLDAGAKVSIAAYSKGYSLLQENFPELDFYFLPGIHVSYQHSGSFALNLAMQVPSIFKSIAAEHKQLQKIISEKKVDAIVSDNRFGLFSNQVPCVFISHQLQIPLPVQLKWMSGFLRRLNYSYINKFSECWVPDAYGENNLAGEMAHPKKLPRIPVKYLGAISRMKKTESTEKKWKAIIVLSGPEPQRTLLEKKIIAQIKNLEGTFLLVRGLPGNNDVVQQQQNLFAVDFLHHQQLSEEIGRAEVLISRSGYTTILDLTVLNIPAIFIPTPGQTEQEVLGQRLMEKNICLSFSQTDFQMTNEMLEEATRKKGFSSFAFESKLNETVISFLELLH